ncbi:MAG: glycosyltransferase [Thermoguttaceae bacterium]|jgi:GT2 family glycosyltransferase
MQSDSSIGREHKDAAALNAALVEALATRIESEARHLRQISEIEARHKEQLAAKEAEIAKKEVDWKRRFSEKEQLWISELSAKEEEMERILNYRSLAIMSLLSRVRHRLLPSGSIRESIARGIFRTAKKLYRCCRFALSLFVKSLRHKITASPDKKLSLDKYDFYFFSIIDWNFRFQRPQQMARQFARAGHRVFYVSQKFTARKNVKIRLIEENIYELFLSGDPTVNVYKHQTSEYVLKKMADSLNKFCLGSNCSTGILLVQLPFWTSLAEEVRARLGWPIVYDCMDEHAGFATNSESMVVNEQRLFEQADLTLVSSELLRKKALKRTSRVALVRNAADYEHFAVAAEKRKAVSSRKITIGYYGAIAGWFDSQLVADLAGLQPDWEFQFVGHTFSSDLNRIKNINNVKLLGEMPYGKLPGILKTWDACIIPFRKIPLTEATNPVKVYEMLAAGMPVVSTDLPEIRSIEQAGLIKIAENAPEFAEQIKRMIRDQSPELIKARQAFARENTWADRCRITTSEIVSIFPKVSVLIAIHNNLELNKSCLSSILSKTDYPNYEVILVDNASTDGSREFALELSRSNNRVKAILNEENESFAKANNRAINSCSGEYVVFLNNDTIVTCGWITRLLRHLKNDSSIGMIGPVSNAVGNEAKIDVTYTSLYFMDDFAERYCRRHDGETFDIPVLALFCAMIKRSLLENVGLLDECFDVGMFEDDDLCMRIKKAGFRIVCAEDVFIHHFQQGTFKLLDPQVFKRVFEANRKRFEEKWGPWKPHQPRIGSHGARTC